MVSTAPCAWGKGGVLAFVNAKQTYVGTCLLLACCVVPRALEVSTGALCARQLVQCGGFRDHIENEGGRVSNMTSFYGIEGPTSQLGGVVPLVAKAP